MEILKQELRDALFIPPSDPQTQWQSPESLRHKFLIRTNVRWGDNGTRAKGGMGGNKNTAGGANSVGRWLLFTNSNCFTFPQLKNATPELKSVVYIANSSFKGCKEMSALPHVTSSSLDENKVIRIYTAFGMHAGHMASTFLPLSPPHI